MSVVELPVLITGGAGFIGTNLADRLLAQGQPVRVLDNLSRPGVEENLEWLRRRHGDGLEHIAGDVRDADTVRSVVDDSAFVFHLAAQVAVTTSLTDPLQDHAINVSGTLNVLEAIRCSGSRPGLMFASTNKVYGALPDVTLQRGERRYVPVDDGIRRRGIDEQRPLQFISPYGCSKGAADQYVLDYCKSFGLAAVVLRMSCIYGPHQKATSDQGWVAHFLLSALHGRRLTIYGDGRQVRDVLFIEDFVSALLAARRDIDQLEGRAFNLGGGVANTLSLLEMIELASQLGGQPMQVSFDAPRTGDQLWFAADHRAFGNLTGWRPATSPRNGVECLWEWLQRSAAEDNPARMQSAGSLA